MSSTPARASTVLALDLAGLAARADRVVVAEVTSVSAHWDRSHKLIVSTIDLSVSDIWKGAPAAKRHLALVQLGGELDGMITRVQGQPTFTTGERAVLFLNGTGETTSLVGMGQGKRPLRFDAASKSWIVEPGDRSAAVELDRQGNFHHVAQEAAVPLDALRQQVLALAAR